MINRIAIIVVLVLSTACGAEARQNELRQLKRSVETLQSQVAHQDARLEALSNRFVTLASKRQEVEPTEPRPLLDVVKLEPEPAEVLTDEDAESEIDEPPIVLTLAGATPPKLRVVAVAEAPVFTQAKKPDHTLFIDGLKAHGAGDDKRAVQYFTDLVARYPSSKHVASAYYWIGECHFEAGDVRAAITSYERVYRAFPRDTKAADALLKTGLSNLKIDDSDAAEDAFEAILSRYPKSAQADLARVHLGRAPTGGR